MEFGQLWTVRNELHVMAFGFTVRMKSSGLLSKGLSFLNEIAIEKAVAARAAAYTKKQVESGFARQSDPYGRRWNKKERPDGRRVLQGKTGKLRNDMRLSIKPSGGFKIVAPVDYASFHQSGTSVIVSRPFFPDSRGLPQKWLKEYRRIFKAEIKRMMR